MLGGGRSVCYNLAHSTPTAELLGGGGVTSVNQGGDRAGVRQPRRFPEFICRFPLIHLMTGRLCQPYEENGRQVRKQLPASHYSRVAGDENGLLASTTNMISSCRSVVPLLETSIGVSGMPIIVSPASTVLTPLGVFWVN